MFPFQQNINEYISSQNIFSDPHQDIMGQIIVDDHLGQPTNFTNLISTQQEPNINNDEKKKMIRKELERKRRQQMSTLHALLRSLLPLQSIKGKRSMSDHLNEAAKYIKHLQNNVEKLRMKRDKLKSIWYSSSADEQTKLCSHNNNNLTNTTTVNVRSHVFGVEIVISCCYDEEENCHLSRVVEAVVEEGFDVVNSISTRTDTRLYHTIHCQQGSNISCLDLAVLQQKVNIAIL